MMTDDSSDHGADQPKALREQAGRGGLRFEAYLPPELADWLLDRIEHGVFAHDRTAAGRLSRGPRAAPPAPDRSAGST
jgi:hypothetical protein